jgi:hypothetical protein
MGSKENHPIDMGSCFNKIFHCGQLETERSVAHAVASMLSQQMLDWLPSGIRL